MNFCNFGKVLIARATKNLEAIKWWNNGKEKSDEKSDQSGSDSENEVNARPKQLLTENLTLKDRHQNYEIYVEGYPKMALDFKTFQKKCPQIQTYLTEKKYWKNNNKTQEQHIFLDHFSLQNWILTIPERERKLHSIQNCIPCNTTHLNTSLLHSSVSTTSKEDFDNCKQLVESMVGLVSPTSIGTKQKGMKVIKSVVEVLQPIVENQLNIKFEAPLSSSISTTNITPKDHKKIVHQSVVSSKEEFQSSLQNNGKDINNFLKSGKSYNQYNRDRFDSAFESIEDASQRQEKENAKGKHHANFSKYQFDREPFIEEIKTKSPGTTVNWTGMARQFNLTCNGKFPLNGGQVLYEYAKSKGVDVHQFNTTKRIAGRDFKLRVRRGKKQVTVNNKRISMPTARPVKELKSEIKKQLKSGDLYIGVEVVPKKIVKTKIDEQGGLTNLTTEIYSRKIPLDRLRQEALQDQYQLGLLRHFTDDEYDSLTFDDIKDRYSRINESNVPENREEAIVKLKQMERTRSMKMWHDHSDILNHSYLSYMISWIYDKANYLTNEEYTQKYPDRKPLNVQSVVERPKLYLFGQSGSSDDDQFTYTDTRLDDLRTLNNSISLNETVKVYDIMRVFSGDGPARQFESGQQRGGLYSCICGVKTENHSNFTHCLQKKELSLASRCNLACSPRSLRELKNGNLNPFRDLRKKEIIDELESRGIYNNPNATKEQLDDELSTLLHGISRPPALLIPNPTTTTTDLNLDKYEVLGCEPLHDITNLVQNIITELPFHVDKSTKKEFESFASTTVNEKRQIKGSDARLYLVKLALLTKALYEDDKIDENIMIMISALQEMARICYSPAESRCPKQILRMYNQCLIFATTCQTVIGKPTKLTHRRFYGSHFHSLTTHSPDILRIFNLRSITTEEEERGFGSLRRISENTSNRKADYVVDNAVLRFRSQNNILTAKPDSLAVQESHIKKQASLLPESKNSVFTEDFIKRRPFLLQAHLQRIPDFMAAGKGVWWNHVNGDLVLHDSTQEPDRHPEGPVMHEFRSSSLVDEHIYLKNEWEKVVENFQNGRLSLPLNKIKVFDYNGIAKYIEPIRKEEDSSDPHLATSPRPENADLSLDEDIAVDHSAAHLHSPEHVEDTAIEQDLVPDPKSCESELRNENAEVKHLYRSFIKDLKSSNTADMPTKLKSKELDQDMTTYPIETNVVVINNLKSSNTADMPTKLKSKELDQDMTKYPIETNVVVINRKRTSPTVKRKLFQTEKKQQSAVPTCTKKSMADYIHEIVGDTQEYQDFIKYKRMTQNHPNDKSIRQRYEKCEMKIQLQVSKCQSDLKKKEHLTSDETVLKRQAECLLRKWNMYYCK